MSAAAVDDIVAWCVLAIASSFAKVRDGCGFKTLPQG
jgi:Kef-type K+ transport system membrane component KefB